MDAGETHEPDPGRTEEELGSELRAIRAENADLRRAVALLRAVVEGIDDPVYAKDHRGSYLLVNPAAARAMGRTPAEVLGRDDAELFPPDTARRIGEDGRRVMAEGQAMTFEDAITSGGITRIYRITKAPYRDDRGRVVGIVGISRDITESKTLLAERDLLLERLRLQIARLPLAYIMVDADDRVLEWNPAAEELFGFTREEALGRESIDLVVPPEARDLVREVSRRVLAGETHVTGINQNRTRDGRTLTCAWFNTLLTGADGRFAGHIALAQDITERRRAEERLARDALLLANVRDSVAVTDLEGIVTYWNKGSTRLFGWRAEEMLGRPMTDRVPEAGRPAMLAAIRAIVAGDEFSGEWEDYRKDGSRVWIDARVTRITDEAGRPVGLMGVAHDITERKRAAAEVAEWKGRYEAAVRATGLVLYDWETATDRIVYGGNCAAILGYAPEELAGNPARWVELIDPEDRPAFAAKVDHVRATREPLHLEYRVRRKDGADIVVRDDAHFVPGVAGSPTRLIGFISDVTERERSKEALQASERRFRRVLEHSRDVIYQLNLSTRTYDYVSPSVRDVLGCTAEELAAGGLPMVLSMLHPEDLERLEGHVARLMARQPGAELEPVLEYRVRVPGKGWRWISDSAAVVRDEAGLPAAVVGAARDVTDQRAAAEQLRHLSRRLLQAQEEERRHIARELHDEIGQALTAVNLNVRAVLRDPASPAAARRLEECMALVQRTIGQVRDLSLDLRPSLLDDLGLVEALRSYASGFAQRSGLAVRFLAGEEIGRPGPEVETACYRIAQEALTNVARHAGAGEVRVTLGRSGSELRLVITDDGSGFDVAAATRRAAGGSSLGVLGMRERARLVGGHTEITSDPGRGTEVRATFPLGESRPAVGGDPPEEIGRGHDPRHPGR